jgi:hypothetical protein
VAGLALECDPDSGLAHTPKNPRARLWVVRSSSRSDGLREFGGRRASSRGVPPIGGTEDSGQRASIKRLVQIAKHANLGSMVADLVEQQSNDLIGRGARSRAGKTPKTGLLFQLFVCRDLQFAF